VQFGLTHHVWTPEEVGTVMGTAMLIMSSATRFRGGSGPARLRVALATSPVRLPQEMARTRTEAVMVTAEVVAAFAATDSAATTATTTTRTRTASPTTLRLPSVTDRHPQSQRVEPEATAAAATAAADNA